MATMARESWTDERLDDLNKKVDDGFAEMRHEFRTLSSELRAEIGGLREELKAEIGGLREEVRTEIGALRMEIGAMHRSFNQLFAGLIGTLLVGVLGVIAAILAHG